MTATHGDGGEPSRDLLQIRTRLILWISLTVGLTFLGVEIALAPRLAAPFIVKCCGVALTIAALLVARTPLVTRHALAFALTVVTGAYLLTALSGIVSPSREYETTAVLFVAASLTTGTLIPWGLWPQALTTLLGGTLLCLAVLRAEGTLQVVLDDPGVAVGVGFVLSMIAAAEVQANRLRWLREFHARSHAEHQLRRLNADLEQRVAARTHELTDANSRLHALSARLESVREEERGRIAREVHDELGQLLTALKIDLDLLPQRIVMVAGRRVADPLLEKLRAMSDLAQNMIHSVRRIATELHPSVLDDLGLPAAIAWQAREFEERCSIACTFRCDPQSLHLEQRRATALYRIAQEALTNVARHAGAQQVGITLQQQDDRIVLEVRDDGRGIGDLQLRSPTSLGLLGMHERARLLDGTLDIASGPGHGTVVRVAIPAVGGRPEVPAVV